MITYSRLGRHGRLGNQLWQVASTLGIAQTLGQSAGFLTWDYRPYFRIPDEFFPPDIMQRQLTQSNATPLVDHIDPRAREYLQDLSLWETIAPQIWSWFQPSEYAMETLRSYDWFTELPRPMLSVHVRRGDNAASPNNCHPLRPLSYYENAIDSLDGQFESVVFFSDDSEWCKANFTSYVIKYPTAFCVGIPRAKEHEPRYQIDPFYDWIDLFMMSFCDLHVIGNSSFAWWGAYLAHSSSVRYPVPWFGADLQYIDASLMFPEDWIGVDHGQIYV